ncbi:cryptochrome circadian regulator 4 [Pygocentrus nattereri]|uniref:Photolyase/cryptochrome alpha/beta domain-containing protein n=1 Tax=Pygocentrus nattereri TaxID=42514 RepID=A0AAR2IX31_PYGNA|nr:cryptochrome circadian regulator 4 [Pygocentrus nattereri]
MPHRTLHLFRKGLRLHDNPTLLGALESSSVVFLVYVLDRAFEEEAMRVGFLQWRFLLQSLLDLRGRLSAVGSRLYVLQGSHRAVLRELVVRWRITQISFDLETEPHHVALQRELGEMAQELGLTVHTCVAHTLYDPRRIIDANGGEAPLTYKKFLRVVSVIGEPDKPVRDITAEDFQRCYSPEEVECEQHCIPSLSELGLDGSDEAQAEVLWPGGETHALQRLHKHLESQGWVQNSKPQAVPNSLWPNTTGLSPYFSFGCLSVRTFYHTLSRVYARARNHALPPVALQGQVLWREFFYTAAAHTPNFTRMEGNPICLQIRWNHDPDALQKWRTAQTGFPWIDAIMTQLRQEGWIHHLSRHAVACFLTRGDLWISWEEGMKVFEEYLLDADYSVNAGNWLWLSASAFFHQYNRIFCPVRFGRRTDPEGRYIRKYVPVLKNFPSRFIYEPWSAPEEVQLQAGCIIGEDYPFPMVCHAEASERNLALMKEARSCQENTAKLTRDVAEEPVDVRVKRELGEEDQPSKRFSSDPQSRPCSWGQENPRLPEITGQAM